MQWHEDQVPNEVRFVFDELGPMDIPEELPSEVRDIYQRAANGRCMACNQPVGRQALVLVNGSGVNQLFCSHMCNIDLINAQFLAELHDNISQAIELRGTGETPFSEEPDDPTLGDPTDPRDDPDLLPPDETEDNGEAEGEDGS